jgi:hypothetical protein
VIITALGLKQEGNVSRDVIAVIIRWQVSWLLCIYSPAIEMNLMPDDPSWPSYVGMWLRSCFAFSWSLYVTMCPSNSLVELWYQFVIGVQFKYEDARSLVCYSSKFGISSLSQPPQRLYLRSMSDATMKAAEY